jgi:hypothetical protein
MSKDLIRYKQHLLSVILIISYVYLHLKLTAIGDFLPLSDAANFDLRMPFAQRILTASMAHFLVYYLNFSAENAFILLEIFFVGLSFITIHKLLACEFTEKESLMFSWLFFLLLPLVTVVNYQFTWTLSANFYYPYDMATLFFMAGGYLLCLKKHWFYLAIWIFIATFNRESAVLLVLLIPCLYWQSWRQYLKPCALALFSYLIARAIVLYIVQDKHGVLIEWFPPGFEHLRFYRNLYWMFKMQNIFLMIFEMAALPLLWFVFYDYIPPGYRLLRYLCLIYFIGLLLVGSFSEARIFIEIVVLMYLPVLLALKRWQIGLEIYPFEPKNTLAYIDRLMPLSILILILAFCPLINKVLSHFLL